MLEGRWIQEEAYMETAAMNCRRTERVCRGPAKEEAGREDVTAYNEVRQRLAWLCLFGCFLRKVGIGSEVRNLFLKR